jgi:hypothetical protein
MDCVDVPELVHRELARFPVADDTGATGDSEREQRCEKMEHETSGIRACVGNLYVSATAEFQAGAGPSVPARVACVGERARQTAHGRHLRPVLVERPMVTLRVIRHDRQEQVLAECQSAVLPSRGEVVQLDTGDPRGEPTRPSTLWRVVSVTVHVPSLASSMPEDGTPKSVRLVDVAVLPDITLVPEFEAAAAQILSESKL